MQLLISKLLLMDKFFSLLKNFKNRISTFGLKSFSQKSIFQVKNQFLRQKNSSLRQHYEVNNLIPNQISTFSLKIKFQKSVFHRKNFQLEQKFGGEGQAVKTFLHRFCTKKLIPYFQAPLKFNFTIEKSTFSLQAPENFRSKINFSAQNLINNLTQNLISNLIYNSLN